MIRSFGIIGLLWLTALLCGCGDGNSPSNNQPPISGWTAFFSSGVNQSGGSFDFPAAPGHINYMVEPPPGKVASGQTITMTFTISGTGTLLPPPATNPQNQDIPPATVSLFLWQKGDDLSGVGQYVSYRCFAGRISIPTPGTYTTSAVLDPTQWIDVYGKPTAAQFQGVLDNLYGLGFTLSGQYFAGHGVYVANGSAHFTLQSYQIQ
jgi:hypothetical protein